MLGFGQALKAGTYHLSVSASSLEVEQSENNHADESGGQLYDNVGMVG